MSNYEKANLELAKAEKTARDKSASVIAAEKLKKSLERPVTTEELKVTLALSGEKLDEVKAMTDEQRAAYRQQRVAAMSNNGPDKIAYQQRLETYARENWADKTPSPAATDCEGNTYTVNGTGVKLVAKRAGTTGPFTELTMIPGTKAPKGTVVTDPGKTVIGACDVDAGCAEITLTKSGANLPQGKLTVNKPGAKPGEPEPFVQPPIIDRSATPQTYPRKCIVTGSMATQAKP